MPGPFYLHEMESIQIKFIHEGKQYDGNFSKVMGPGNSSTYHLVDPQNFYLGRLRIANNQWTFDVTPRTQELKGLAHFSEITLQTDSQ